jgi:hypothetical protein
VEDEDEDRPRRRRRRFEDDEEDDYERPLRRYVMPHRGGLVLTLGILAIVTPCGVIFGPISWIMGNTDMSQIRAGTMDRDGEGLTQAGRILGMVATILTIISFAFLCFIFLLAAVGRH